MPRPSRNDLPGALYHAMARGNAGLLDEKEPTERPRHWPLFRERLAAVLPSSIPLKLLCSRSQARKITAARRDLILRALKEGHRPTSIAAF